MGGADTVRAGFGPNTRTIMQITVNPGAGTPFSLAALQAEFTPPAPAQGVFAQGQDPIIVGQSAYNSAYNTTFPATAPNWGISTIFDNAISFQTVNPDGTFTLMSNLPMEPKAIQDEMGEVFDEYGRMSAKLGLELPFTTALNQTFVLQNYVDPATEILNDGEIQIWKITHNGVDTHPIHFHLFDVQLLNRVGWDGFITMPDPNELGWKDTVRISPLMDTIVALRPIAPKVPFGQPDSVRPLNPAIPLGSTMGFSNVDPTTAQAIEPPIPNQFVNFGWEYVWHCHILSHEEQDMMRPIHFNGAKTVAAAPVLIATGTPGNPIALSWTDGTPFDYSTGLPSVTVGNPANEIGFRIERATANGAFAAIGTALANVTSFNDNTTATNTRYRYRVVAFNAAGDSPSNVVIIGSQVRLPVAPTNLVATLLSAPLRVGLTWRDNATNETDFEVERSDNGGPFAVIAAPGPLNGTGNKSYVDRTVQPGNTYTYRVQAVNTSGPSGYSNEASVTIPGLPAAPSNVTVSAVRLVNNATRDRVTVQWTDNASNETGFTIQRATNAAFTSGLATQSVGANVTTFGVNTNRNVTYYYRVRANNQIGSSAWVNATPFPITTP